ncbi:MAG: transcription-repair coupling factor [Planctomycetaceae bacterium]|nr:transcription-repair coupling factor [Planctomycetaceae bacterium]
MPTEQLQTYSQLSELVLCLHQNEGFSAVVAALRNGHSAAVDGAWGSACALTAAALAEQAPSTIIVVLSRVKDADEFADDLSAFVESTPLVFPAWETLPQEHDVTDSIFGGRLRVLRALAAPSPPQIVVTSIAALLQPVPSRQELKQSTRTIRVGDELEPDDFLKWLHDRGFDRVTGIQLPGEFSVHGGIVDVYPPDALDPLRFEFFGDEVESIRCFDVESQRTIQNLDEAGLTLVAPVKVEDGSNHTSSHTTGEHFCEALPSDAWVGLVELQELVEEGRHYLDRLSNPRGMYTVEATLSRCTDFPSVSIAPLSADSFEISCHLQIESIERFTGPKSEVLQELASVVGQDEHVLIACHNEGERDRLTELFEDSDSGITERVQFCVGRVARGFRLVFEQLIVISDHELFGRTEVRRKTRKRRIESRAIDSFLDLNEGDLVVHLTNGIGRYRGMKLLEKDGATEEHLVLEFRDRVHVYVPISLIHLVQKYVGAAKSVPTLSKLGTTTWSKKKKKVAEAVHDLAADMLRLQAAREAKPGLSYPADTKWQLEFEASFPYTETKDQVQAINDCKDDLERNRPMDRLICGDVGYGKTEVAMRSIFKVVDSGRQAAVLVPTTVLAEQHFRTFSERMAEYPITIACLSRFKAKSELQQSLEGMAAGSVDVVVGTHRLVQKDVRFKDLGIIVIDEEQRFGVAAKEMLKQLRLEVDVLTLSATPIPRTLHMSLLGIRDISNLQTAPQDRMSIVTRVCRFDGDLVRQAIVRELNRNGQVYFVHNRVYNIHAVADRIREIVPEATIDVAHGQMSGNDLEDAMWRFVTGRTDVLVCTTIIESGVDIPNANTICIHQANIYGLADLHQLRGRVGRYRNRAYCYLLLEEGRTVTTTAAKRLKAIEEYSELGAGFKIAMRDLEIRGAGNILGTEQSGHIMTVGYELYCQLLENAVRRLKNEAPREFHHTSINLPVKAYIPDSYIPPGRQKIEMYRKLSLVKSLEDLEEVADELRDRYGPVPQDAEQLLKLKELQVLAQQWRIDDIHPEDQYIVFRYRNPQRIRQLEKGCGADLRIVDDEHAYLVLDSEIMPIDELLSLLKTVLQPC